MSSIHVLLSKVNRPRLLIKAARIGLRDYNRDRRLPKILEELGECTTEDVAYRLLIKEAELNTARRQGNASYSCARHIEILTALMAEANQASHEIIALHHHPATPRLVGVV